MVIAALLVTRVREQADATPADAGDSPQQRG
jgi:hypothetical protein